MSKCWGGGCMIVETGGGDCFVKGTCGYRAGVRTMDILTGACLPACLPTHGWMEPVLLSASLSILG